MVHGNFRTAQKGEQIYSIVQYNCSRFLQHLLDGFLRTDLCGFETIQLSGNLIPLLLKTAKPLWRNQPDVITDGSQTQIRIIIAQQQPVFRTGG
ncbi:hypothetical protein D3C75_1008180 [compost metagenome]